MRGSGDYRALSTKDGWEIVVLLEHLTEFHLKVTSGRLSKDHVRCRRSTRPAPMRPSDFTPPHGRGTTPCPQIGELGLQRPSHLSGPLSFQPMK